MINRCYEIFKISNLFHIYLGEHIENLKFPYNIQLYSIAHISLQKSDQVNLDFIKKFQTLQKSDQVNPDFFKKFQTLQKSNLLFWQNGGIFYAAYTHRKKMKSISFESEKNNLSGTVLGFFLKWLNPDLVFCKKADWTFVKSGLIRINLN